MKKMHDSLENRLSGVEWTAEDSLQVLTKIRKEEEPVKKKISIGMIVVFATLAIAAVALAIASQNGMLDFLGRYDNVDIPENADAYITQGMSSWSGESVTLTLRESYFDGHTIRVVADVAPNNPETALVPDDNDPSDRYIFLSYGLTAPEDGYDMSDMRTIPEGLRDAGFKNILWTVVNLLPANRNDMGDGVRDYVLHEDGSITIYEQMALSNVKGQLDYQLEVWTLPLEDLYNWDQAEKMYVDLSITAAQSPSATQGNSTLWVSAEPADFPSAGVRIDQIRIEEAPLELYYTIEMTVIDQDTFEAGEVFMEFIDPESSSEVYSEQRLKEGLTLGSGVIFVDEEGNYSPEPTSHLRQYGTLGISELRTEYTIRAYDCFEKGRYEAITFTMKAE